jgi:hypothetical protein
VRWLKPFTPVGLDMQEGTCRWVKMKAAGQGDVLAEIKPINTAKVEFLSGTVRNTRSVLFDCSYRFTYRHCGSRMKP